jgi:hypothetical protein
MIGPLESNIKPKRTSVIYLDDQMGAWSETAQSSAQHAQSLTINLALTKRHVGFPVADPRRYIINKMHGAVLPHILKITLANSGMDHGRR